MKRIKKTLVAAATFAATASAATAEGWTPLDPSRGHGRGAIVCNDTSNNTTGNYLCFALRCLDGGQLEFAMIAEGGDFGDGSPIPVGVSVDDQVSAMINMVPTQTRGQKRASAPVDMAAHEALIEAMRSGSRMRVGFFGTSFPLSLRGSNRQIGQALQSCNAAPAATSTGNGNLSADEVRTQLLGRHLTWADGAASTIYLQNGRFEGVLEGRANNGTYRVEPDGRICWQGHVAGCFRFYREGDVLMVRRDDSRSSASIGSVTIE